MDDQAVRCRVEKLCEALVLAGPGATVQLQEIEAGFREVASWSGAQQFPALTSALDAVCHQLGQLHRGEASHPDAAFDVINRAADAIQSIVCGGRKIEDVAFPQELNLPKSPVKLPHPKAGPKIVISPAVASSAPKEFPMPPAPQVEPKMVVPAPAAPAASKVFPMPSQGLIDMDLVDAFVMEAREHLDAIETHLLAIQGGKIDKTSLDALFRAYHTIKGSAAFMNLDEISRLAHGMEDLLERVRAGELVLNDAVADLSFEVMDTLKALILGLHESKDKGGVPPTDPRTEGLLKRILAMATQATVAREFAKAQAPVESATRAAEPISVAAREAMDTIRVDAERLDRLLDTIGELVIAESMVSHSPEVLSLGSAELERSLNQLDKITRALQEMSTSLRMVSIKPVFLRMSRLVRDLARKANKAVEFVTVGDDTELDKAMVDRIGDPLVHLLRNAVDHGIETSPAKRRAAGKPDRATIQLRAFHRGGNIFIEVEDDGRGMDRQKILSRGREMGLIGSDVTVDDHGLLDVIFEPGFSTADEVTDVSGRGVGMDVVKRNVEALRGRIEMMSTPGKGTLISIRLPLSLAIIDGMIIMAGRERYIIPTLSVVRSLRPRAEDLVTVTQRGEMISVEGKLVPLFRLGQLFDISDAVANPLQGIVVLVEDAGRQVALLADGLLGQQQIVIKGLGDYLHGSIGIAGGAIMPDGRVGLIIDVNGLVRLAHRTGTQKVEETESSATKEVAVNQERDS